VCATHASLLRRPCAVGLARGALRASRLRQQRLCAAPVWPLAKAGKEHAPRRAAMAFFDLCVAMLLFFNAVAILNEDRFLAKRAALALREGGMSAFWPRFSLRSENAQCSRLARADC
jgi:hypothetical protein